MANAIQSGKEALFANPTELLATLHRIPAFDGLREDQLHCLADAELLEMPTGTVFVKQGETDHFYWIILEGGTRVFQKQADGREVTVARIPGQNAFGELPILSNSSNPTSVETIAPTRALKLPENGF